MKSSWMKEAGLSHAQLSSEPERVELPNPDMDMCSLTSAVFQLTLWRLHTNNMIQLPL